MTRATSRRAAPTGRRKLRGTIDVAIITIKKEEFQAVLAQFPPAPSETCFLSRAYVIREVKQNDGRVATVAITRCGAQGNGVSQDVLRDIARDLDPRWVLCVGIAGAAPVSECALGDVLLGSNVIDTSVEAIVNGKVPTYAAEGLPAHWEVERYCAIVDGLGSELGDWATLWDSPFGTDRKRLAEPPISRKPSNLYGDDQWQARVRKVLKADAKTRPRSPTVSAGLIAASDRLVKADAVLAAWLKVARHIRAVEMESAGVYRAARGLGRYRKAYPAMTIRGISDIVGLERDEAWTRYACTSAAAFAYAFVRSGHVPGRSGADADGEVSVAGGTSTKPTATATSTATAARLSDAERTALVQAWLRDGERLHARIPVIGMRGGGPMVVPRPVDEVYVELRIDQGQAAMDRAGSKSVDLEEALAASRRADPAEPGRLQPVRMVLLGDPGAGKTSILRHLFGRVARGDTVKNTLAALVPVWLNLSMLASEQRGERGHLDDATLGPAIERVARERGHERAAQAVLAGEPKLLVLLDGLDEVRDFAARPKALKLVEKTVAAWRKSAFVLTSRRDPWKAVPGRAAWTFTSLFEEVDVSPLTSDGRERYATTWFRAMQPSTAAADVAAWLAGWEARARTNDRLGPVIANPLMLSALCALRASGSVELERQPVLRPGDIYDAVLRLLIQQSHRPEASGAPDGMPLPFGEVRGVLAPLAYRSQEGHGRALSRGEAEEVVRAAVARTEELARILTPPESFLDVMRDDCGILSRDIERKIEFVHLQFREYLAARHVAGEADAAQAALAARLASHLGTPDEAHWRETTLLAVSLAGVSGPFLAAALAAAPAAGGLRASRAMVRDCVLEAGERCDGRPLVEAIEHGLALLGRRRAGRAAAIDRLHDLFFVGEGTPIAEIAALRRRFDRALGTEAAGRGWTKGKPATLVLPGVEMTFEWVKAGQFQMGSDDTDAEAFSNERPAHRVHITRGFWLARHPVTNEQYRAFIAANPGVREPESWSDRRFRDPRQPVVSVSWHDAQAFCAWANAQGPTIAGYQLRLPTEAEWEYAARGPRSRRYPWGNEPRPTTELATFGQDFGTGHPSPVGGRPGGRSWCKVHDLAGNVFEWCLDPKRDYAARDERDPGLEHVHQDASQGPYRVLRGGSWDSGAGRVRAARRFALAPDDADGNLGLRLAGGPAPSKPARRRAAERRG